MNRYQSSERWNRQGAGSYYSRVGRHDYHAERQADSRWALFRREGWVVVPMGRFLTLADCQEHAVKLERPRVAPMAVR